MEKIKQNNIFGSPIFKQGNVNCKFYYDNLGKKGDASKFSECTCPVREHYKKENNYGSIIKCAKDVNECPIYVNQNQSDITIIQNYILKYGDDNWVQIPNKHWELLRDEKISIHTDEYLDMLFKFFGFYNVENENVEGTLYCGEKLKASEKVSA